MTGQEIILLALFILAAGYIGWRFWKNFSSSNNGGCAKGCGCSTDKAMKV